MTHHRAFIKIILLGLGIAFIVVACSNGPGASPPKDPAGDDRAPIAEVPLYWADVLEKHKIPEATYAIGIFIPGYGINWTGTGFAAHYTNGIWTNAHVIVGLRTALVDLAHRNPFPLAVQSGESIGSAYVLDVSLAVTHPQYIHARSPDVGVIPIASGRTLAKRLNFLPQQHVTELRVGQPIGTLGFPGEHSDNPYQVVPLATFKDGTISVLRPYSNLETSVTPAIAKIVQHNLDLSKGTSGSPIFDVNGYVVAVNNAGIDRRVYDSNIEKWVWIDSGNVGWGIRVDEVWGLIDLIEAAASSTTLKAAPDVIPAPAQYQPFPENWNGTTVAPFR